MNLHFFGLDLELNSAYYKINLIFLLCAEPYSRPLAKCFVTPSIWHFLVVMVIIPRLFIETKRGRILADRHGMSKVLFEMISRQTALFHTYTNTSHLHKHFSIIA